MVKNNDGARRRAAGRRYRHGIGPGTDPDPGQVQTQGQTQVQMPGQGSVPERGRRGRRSRPTASRRPTPKPLESHVGQPKINPSAAGTVRERDKGASQNESRRGQRRTQRLGRQQRQHAPAEIAESARPAAPGRHDRAVRRLSAAALDDEPRAPAGKDLVARGGYAARAGAPPPARPAFVPARIRSEAFSAIMIVAALVLPEITVGITEASTTRSPSTPRTRNSVSDDGAVVRAHHAGAGLVEGRAAGALGVFEQVVRRSRPMRRARIPRRHSAASSGCGKSAAKSSAPRPSSPGRRESRDNSAASPAARSGRAT